jgi:hypothetical protein
MTERIRNPERDARLRALGIDPENLVDERDVEYLLGDAFRTAGVEITAQQQDAVVCTLLGYRHPDSLQVGDPVPDLLLHRLDDGPPVAIGQLHRTKPLVLFFGSYT